MKFKEKELRIRRLCYNIEEGGEFEGYGVKENESMKLKRKKLIRDSNVLESKWGKGHFSPSIPVDLWPYFCFLFTIVSMNSIVRVFGCNIFLLVFDFWVYHLLIVSFNFLIFELQYLPS